jgi:hypothetical protein
MKIPRRQRNLHYPVALGCSCVPKKVGDRVWLRRGPQLILLRIEEGVEIYYARSGRGRPDMWTAHRERPGVYVRVGEWPDSGLSFDVEEAKKRARTAYLIAETLFDLDRWMVR